MSAFVYGAILAAVVAALAWRARSLSPSGAVAAFAVGTIVFGWKGWPGAAVLFAFFIPSAMLSRVGKTRKRAMLDVGKQGARDAWQVLANGGVAAACALPYGDTYASLFAAAFAGAFAAAAADTWGTEIGTLVRSAPRSILTLRPIATGMSGGITAGGTAATVAGAAFVGAVAAATHVAAFVPVVVGGVAGALLDSVLGASLQALRWCPSCAVTCETNPHRCGTPTSVRRGLGWLENDAVNLAATLAGAVVAGVLAR
ncbi:MAG TPA: DUF92 domain-containing protein [Candidatus Baltobacteraceae bacterium]|nr:DUF92 domain-containing protein [Candidatus Baltobacteraceae bacterium]